MNPRIPRAPRSFRPAHFVQRRLRALGFHGKHEWMASNLGKELGFINYELLEPCGEPVTSAGGFELLCSYNWRRCAKQQQPQIFVPGEAPRLVPHKLPLTTRDHAKGWTFRDVNAALMPAHPFEPMFRAVGVMRPGFRFDDVDVVINRSSLHHILRLADGGKCKDAFRLDLAMMNNTLIVTPLWKTVSGRGNYGRIFEQYFTRNAPDVAESQSHHRAIRYDLGPLKVAVLCEVDAACSGLPSSWASNTWEVANAAALEQQKPPAPLAGVQDALDLQASAETALFAAINQPGSASSIDPKLSAKVAHRGKGTLSAHTAELVTMVRFGRKTKIPQMWLGRTPYLIESTHTANTFTGIKVTHSSAHLLAFEETHQDALQKLVTAVKMLVHFATRAVGRHAIAVCTKDPPGARALRVFEAADQPRAPLPLVIQRRFWAPKLGRGAKARANAKQRTVDGEREGGGGHAAMRTDYGLAGHGTADLRQQRVPLD